MKRVLSGIKPSGEVTLGNYLGAMKRWAEMSSDRQAEHFFFVPNLHALTVRQDPEELRRNTLAAVAWLLAMGVDPEHSVIYIQSQIPAHSELMWILNNYVTMGELSRMTQYKDKSQQLGPEGQLVGLFDYPVLMAADILLYDADEVPVGEDQVQHIEITRDIAQRFNNLHGETFKLPRATVQKEGARIMSLQNPTRKMSKSETDDSGCVLLTSEMGVIREQFMKAVTDSEGRVTADPERPGISNLLTIYSLLAEKPVGEIESEYEGKGYGEFKKDLADLAVSVLEPIQKCFDELMADEAALQAVISRGDEQAGRIASQKLAQVKAKIGLL